MKTTPSEKFRHVVLRAELGDVLPDTLLDALRESAVAAGWLRASGVVTEVELRAYSSEARGLGASRRIAGPVQLLALEGTIGMSRGDLSVGMRAVIAREGDRGMETLAGELVAARVVALEALVTALDDVPMGRALDDDAGVWLVVPGGGAPRPKLQAASPAHAAPLPERPAAAAPPTHPAAWSEAIAASEAKPPVRSGGPGSAMPARIARPERDTSHDGDAFPEAGDTVDHFAFGRCDVIKSDGDRLHLKVPKDGRIKEIALEMLRVIPLESEGPKRHFRLERKM